MGTCHYGQENRGTHTTVEAALSLGLLYRFRWDGSGSLFVTRKEQERVKGNLLADRFIEGQPRIHCIEGTIGLVFR